LNYYERHIGDYSRLLDVYYTRESALPADQVHRLVGCRTAQERKATDAVLAEFFRLVDGAWRQSRCDEEIEKFASGAPEREAKQANRDLRVKKHRAERAAMFRRLHAVGQHADWNIPIKDLRALVDRCCPEPVTESVTAVTAHVTTVTGGVTASSPHSHSPDTRHQTQVLGEEGTPAPVTHLKRPEGNGEPHSAAAQQTAADKDGPDSWREAGCDIQAMEAWLTHRAKCAKPLPDHARIHAAQILRGMGDPETQRAAVKTAIANNWQALRVSDGQATVTRITTRKSMTERLAALGDDEPEAKTP
jgi:uncharacterized protein YdaU (DUF1376 family)